MSKGTTKIGVVATGSPIDDSIAKRLTEVVEGSDVAASVEIVIHATCFMREGHFAGSDVARAEAFLEIANDSSFDAVWFARGGYGTCRLLDHVMPRLTEDARAKTYLGYSDAGFLLGALYQDGFPHLVHGPMPADLLRTGGEVAVARALSYLVERNSKTLEPSVDTSKPALAFNMTIFSKLLGTPFVPDVTGHVLMLEEVSEYMYAIDRLMFHITSNQKMRKCAGIALGRCSDVPDNDYPFGMTDEEIVKQWCDKAGIPYLGRADIGHDVDNKVVVFGIQSAGV